MTRTQKQKPDFETALVELERIVTHLESGQITLNDALAQFQRGSELILECQATLTAAEARLVQLEQGVTKDPVLARTDLTPLDTGDHDAQ